MKDVNKNENDTRAKTLGVAGEDKVRQAGQSMGLGAFEKGESNDEMSSQRSISRKELSDSVRAYLGDCHNREKRIGCEKFIARWLDQVVDRFPAIKTRYRILFLYADRTLQRCDADGIYSALQELGEDGQNPILLILHSPGGYPGPAYLIGKILQASSSCEVEIAVPRWAKSAATLLCCAASHIHMGGLSELGPIDPQVGSPPMPALGLKAAVEHIVELVEQHPETTDLFVGYMQGKVDPMDLGYFDRASESAIQYAERLLISGGQKVQPAIARKIAARLVHGYMDHGFVIDRDEATQVFGDGMIKSDNEEYELADAIYNELHYIEWLATRQGFKFSFVGSQFSAPVFVERR